MSRPFDHPPLFSKERMLTDAERDANSEALAISRQRLAGDPDRVLFSRKAVLDAMGTWSGGVMANSEIMALLDQHEANLRKAWENVELGRAQQRAQEVIRHAVP